MGTSLVPDEFALILHLQDAYWSGEGQLSVQVVTLMAACLGLALVGFSPYGVQAVDSVELSLRLSATSVLLIDGVLAVICALKGKYRSALFGLFLPALAAVGAPRLGRPSSIWARHFYHGEQLQRATRRAAEFDRRWVPVQTDWEDFIGGRPSPPSHSPPGTTVTLTEPSLGQGAAGFEEPGVGALTARGEGRRNRFVTEWVRKWGSRECPVCGRAARSAGRRCEIALANGRIIACDRSARDRPEQVRKLVSIHVTQTEMSHVIVCVLDNAGIHAQKDADRPANRLPVVRRVEQMEFPDPQWQGWIEGEIEKVR